ncbi:MAG TPA: ABC transporter substrate-binding protein [Acidimicrobiales bacterium]|nr:ABC transporter substrate-binding protein [Acidimicrobiales bacterium]
MAARGLATQGAANWRRRFGAAGLAMSVLVVGATVEAGPVPAGAAVTVPGKVVVGKNVPSSAMKTTIGVTANSITVGNISWSPIFKGAAIGTKAYFDYVNSKGGVNGRKITVTAQNTTYSGTKDASLTQAAIGKNFALVGDFSIVATSAAKVLAKNPGFPDVSVTVTPLANKLPNFVSPVPLGGGWQEGSLKYFKSQNPSGIKKAAALVADQPSATQAWQGQEATMKHLGYNIVYQTVFKITANYNSFVSDVVAMKAKGVKMLFIEQNPPLYAVPLIKALASQDFHPMVILGASTYSATLIATSGPPSATNGMYLEQNLALYLGTDAKAIPAVTLFNKWVKKETASFSPDLFTLYGWLSAQLFTQGLKNAGKNPTRGSLLKALGTITSFTGTNLTAPTNPAAKTVSNCYLIGRIKNGQWVRQADPSISSKTNGYRCTDQYYVPPNTPY